jgi:site-specific recombinase XerD
MSAQTSGQKQNKKLSNLINYFEICNKSEGRSAKTISWYSANLRQFHRYLQARHLPDSIEDIDIQLLREYILFLQNRKKFTGHPYTPAKPDLVSAATVHGHVRTLRAFFSWLVREGLVQNDAASNLKPPKLPKRIVSTLSDEEIKAILNTLNSANSCDARNQTIVMLLLDTGLRIQELTSLKMDDTNLDQGVLKVMGKGQKERIVPIGNNVQRSLQRYLFRYRPEPAHMGIDSVFLSTSGTPLTENSLKLMFARLSRRSGVSRLHAHLCRHTFATRFLINGGDVFTLQQILGHSTLEMVRHYVNLASSHITIQHRRFSPLDRLDLRKN